MGISHSELLHSTLETLYHDYQADYLEMDPLELVRQYHDPRDQEIAAFIAAGLAIGQSDLIRKTVKYVLTNMLPSPYRFLQQASPAMIEKTFHTFVYRFYRARDIGLLLWWMAQMLESAGSIFGFFIKSYSAAEKDIGPSLSRFVQSVLLLKSSPFYANIQKGQGIRHFLSDPSDGSACKRLNLYLRWMVRKDSLDLGLWPEISTRQLIIPLDTHIARFSRHLGLSARSAMDWRMAQEITDALRQLDPDDPVKYDFAICTLGKLSDCARSPDPVRCRTCPIFRLCNAAEILN